MADEMYLIKKSTLDEISGAIQEKAGITGGLDPEGEMAAAVRGIEKDAMLKALVEEGTDIADLILPSGLKKIGPGAFTNYKKLVLTELPDGVTSIGDTAFYYCSKLQLTTLPSGLKSVGANSFNASNIIITELPESLESLGEYAFSQCRNMVLKKIPRSLVSIGQNAFRHCLGLTELTFHGIPNTLETNTFYGCANLLAIRVPWAEGEVANAPWGATNAEIIYDYVEESE